MLQFMLDAHSKVTSLPEPHVMVPLGYLGYFDRVEKARYDTVNASLALQEFVKAIPEGEKSYIQACRAYASALYGKALETKTSATLFVDKTPPNVLEWKFITKVFPKARYLVLVRHPVAVLHSLAETFFMGDYELMSRQDRGLGLYVSAIKAFMEGAEVEKILVKYEDIVEEPGKGAHRLAEFLGVEFEEEMVEYGRVSHKAGALGDPMTARKLAKPVAGLNDKWVNALLKDSKKLKTAQKIISQMDSAELGAYGYEKESIFTPMQESAGQAGKIKSGYNIFDWYQLKRRVFFTLARMARWKPMRKLLEALRYYCDVLLRD